MVWKNARTLRVSWVIALAITMAATAPLGATIIYSNDFETDTAAMAAGGTLTGLTRISLPTDSGGMNSPNKSMWLGKLGSAVNKSSTTPETVTLTLANLTPGTQYDVAFDLLIGASWDGAAGGYGPDRWRFSVDGVNFIDTMFSNNAQGVNAGAYSPQRYTDTFYSTPGVAANDVPRFTGAEASWSANRSGDYANDYAIYFFGHGAGNPTLSFTAATSTAVLQFSRPAGGGDSADEYWALDNVQVTGIPEPGAALCLAALTCALLSFRPSRR